MTRWAREITPEKVLPEYPRPQMVRKEWLNLNGLWDYWYICAWQAHTTGMPVWHHLVLTDPGIPDYHAKDDEFMVGDWFYFAPILNEGNSRPVYLPKGRWIDYFTGQVFDGPRTIESYDTPIDRVPLFVKAGAIIPRGPEICYVSGKPLSPLTLDWYPYGCPESRYSLYEDDGISTKYLDGDCCTTPIGMCATKDGIAVTIHARDGKFTPPERACELLFHGIVKMPAAGSLNGMPLDAIHDPKTGILRVSFPDTGKEQKFIVQR
ncbi:MAG: DUF5110 domain-containing protein [Verrucomicrobia bacterium]|nr:DUF5110 domain-containing protein [Verrucomicrobiota bacterium]